MRSLLCAIALLSPCAAFAHGMRTAYFELTETEPGSAAATLRMTAIDPQLVVRLDGCEMTPAGSAPATHTYTFSVRCPSAIAGRTVRVSGMGTLTTETVVRAELASGAIVSGVARAEATEVALRSEQNALSTVADYWRLGVVHIATGFDHLLFLLALTLQLWRARAVLLAETAFTVSHTLSFSATALGWIHVSPLAAEACIALSLVLIASELFARRSVSVRRGAIVALLFGAIHGLGFAGGLRAIGLPEQSIGSALIGFGAGVETGQVLFLGLLLGLAYLGPVERRRGAIAWAGGLAVGVAGAFWFCERVAALAWAAKAG